MLFNGDALMLVARQKSASGNEKYIARVLKRRDRECGGPKEGLLGSRAKDKLKDI